MLMLMLMLMLIVNVNVNVSEMMNNNVLKSIMGTCIFARNPRPGTEVKGFTQKYLHIDTQCKNYSSWNSSELSGTEACLNNHPFDAVQETSSWHRSDKFGTQVDRSSQTLTLTLKKPQNNNLFERSEISGPTFPLLLTLHKHSLAPYI
ncbi:hypothetical protein M0812_08921 [Anaeramoeba flamelloides]|uniref:Uncharacterized protein n=1 Tax=Anaeramoeba flamelloides TaxID=1746091 RepID=A0AAV8A1C6_9EUKA|nr:hypothetical protein M0812_08921 [Anaeramoeba flamelloides]